MKSVITDVETACSSNRSNVEIDNETGNSDQPANSTQGSTRRRSHFRRRRVTTSIEGPTGAPPLGAVSMTGAAGGGPAAWAAAAFGRAERKVLFNVTFI